MLTLPQKASVTLAAPSANESPPSTMRRALRLGYTAVLLEVGRRFQLILPVTSVACGFRSLCSILRLDEEVEF